MTVPGRPSVGYSLRVKGRLDARWAAWFDGFTLTAQLMGRPSSPAR